MTAAVSRLDKSKMACNKPRKSPNPKKKKVVKACANGREKIIHFGATGYGHNYSAAARKSFKARHAKNIARGKTSAAFWANKVFWSGPGGSKKSPPKSQKHTKGLKRR